MPPFKLPSRPRKAVLTLHVLSSGAWIGIDVVFAVLVASAMASDDPHVDGVVYETVGRFLAAPMLVMGLVSLVTGLLLGLGTKYGLLRYWWVAVKLVINVVLVALVLVLLMPGMDDVRADGAALLAGGSPAVDVSKLVMPPIVSLVALTVATVLSVFKPWGRLRPTEPRTTVSRVHVGTAPR